MLVHAAAAAGQAKGEEGSTSDAAILAACADYLSAYAEEQEIMALPSEAKTDERGNAIDAQVSMLCRRYITALQIAECVPARTLGGLKAKAAMLQIVLPQAVDDFQLDSESLEIKLATSLARDILGRAG